MLNKYFNGDELAESVWLQKYAQPGEQTPDDMHRRLAIEFAKVNSKYQKKLSTSEQSLLSNYGKNRILLTEERIFNLFKDFKYIVPQGSVMSGLGSNKPVSFSNCFVLPHPKDSIEDIMNTGRDMAQIYKRRGGVGFDISHLRPHGATVKNAANTSTGAVSFMNLFSTITNTIGQEGRRGALMLSIDINHPDSPEFAVIKRDLTQVTGANISIKLNDAFINAVKNNTDYILKFPCENGDDLENYKEYTEYNKLYPSPYNDGYIKRVKAKELWETIVESNWLSAEPGIFNWEHLVNYDPTGTYSQFKPISTNPCGELGLSGYDSCRLILTNLYSFVDNPFTPEASFNEELAYQIFYETQILADNLVDLELEAIDRILTKINPNWENDKHYIQLDSNYNWVDNQTDEFKLWWKMRDIGERGRRSGTGITAYGDMMAALNLPYGSEEMTEKIFSLKLKAELDASIDMAIIRGSFPDYNINNEFDNYQETDTEPTIGLNDWYNFILKQYPEQASRMINHGRRNAGISTIAPAGSVSILTQTTSGVEPLFMPYYTRRKKCNPGEEADFVDQNGIGFKEYFVLHPKFKVWFDIKYSNIDSKDLNEFTEEELKGFFEESPWFNQTSDKLDLSTRIDTQALIQKYITSSISSTCNLSAEATKEMMSEGYLEAFEKGCKGLTYYRDGSRSGILVNDAKKDIPLLERPETLPCKIIRFRNEKKNWIAFVGTINDNPYEIFTGINAIDEFPIPSYVENGIIIKVKSEGRSRYDFQYVDNYGYTNTLGGLNRIFDKEYWNYARFVSALLREGTEIINIINIIEKLEFNNRSLNSWQSGIIRSLKSFVPDGTESKGEKCPDCGEESIVYESGCKICKSCGSTSCE